MMSLSIISLETRVLMGHVSASCILILLYAQKIRGIQEQQGVDEGECIIETTSSFQGNK